MHVSNLTYHRPIILEHLSALLSTSTQYSILLIERAVVALLRLCRILAKEPKLRDQVYVSFDVLARLPSSVSSSVAEPVIQGLLSLVQEHREIIRLVVCALVIVFFANYCA